MHKSINSTHKMAAKIDATSGSYDRMKEVKEFDDSKMGVKGLSDSGITVIPQIFVHDPQTLSDLKPSSKNTTTTIPTIDLSHINSAAHRPKIVDQVKSASKTFGFFQVTNHGVPVSVLDETITAVKAFHELPQEDRAKYYKRNEGKGVMYASNADLYRTSAASWRDSLQVWMSPERGKAEEVPEACREELFLVGHCYPYCPQPDRTIGITAHTYVTALTVLLRNHVPGLQVRHENEWLDVKTVPGGLIINVGDLLQIISNGEYKSVQHRVLANSWKEALISVVMFFYHTKWREDNYYGPLPELLSPEKPPIYRDFTKHELLENYYSKGLDSKSFIDKVTIKN
ncbi:hypothetical protein EV1_008679 [Malus domestica]